MKTRTKKNKNTKLTLAKVERMRSQYETGKFSMRALAAKNGVAKTTVWKLLNRVTWK